MFATSSFAASKNASVIPVCIQEQRRLTYQVTMAGCDGIVMASDQREQMYGAWQIKSEAPFPAPNPMHKIRLDEKGGYAWCFAGGYSSVILSRNIGTHFNTHPPTSDEDAWHGIEESIGPTLDENPNAIDQDRLIMACGKSKRVFHCDLKKTAEVREFPSGKPLFAGIVFNPGTLLPMRLYNPALSADVLARMAAYSVLCVGAIDNWAVDGLDLAIYRDSTGRFDFVEDEEKAAYLDIPRKLDAAILDALRA